MYTLDFSEITSGSGPSASSHGLAVYGSGSDQVAIPGGSNVIAAQSTTLGCPQSGGSKKRKRTKKRKTNKSKKGYKSAPRKKFSLKKTKSKRNWF